MATNIQPNLAITRLIVDSGIYPSEDGGDGYVSIGYIVNFAGNYAIVGTEEADGFDAPIASALALFSLIGTTYGGDGAATFGLPDLRGNLSAGSGQGPGLTSRDPGELWGNDNFVIEAGNLPASFGGNWTPVDNAETTLATRFIINVTGLYPSPEGGGVNLGFMGMISEFAGDFAPSGTMFCEGQLLSISENEALFTIIGTTFGGDGVTTFALPDLRGRVPVGTGLGVVLGEQIGTEGVFLGEGNLPIAIGGGGQAVANQQPGLGLTMLIAVTGLFPGFDDPGFETNNPFNGATPYLGQIVYFAGNFAPKGFALTHGQTLQINVNQALFSVLGTQFGGDGVTTFALPDTRGRSLIGADSENGVGTRTGTVSMTLVLADIPGRTQSGDSADNTIVGANYADTFFGFGGNDQLFGGDGNDILRGHGGDDLLNGGDGDDYLVGGAGLDVLIGGRGNDVYVVTRNVTTVTELASEGIDTIHSRVNGFVLPDHVEILYALDGLTARGNDLDNEIYGSGANDSLSGGSGNDNVYGRSGNDALSGQDGDDTLFGDTGDDVLNGGNGDDTLYGGPGTDQLAGGGGNDTLYGGAGHDTLGGSTGNDVLQGEGGNDSLFGDGGSDTLVGGDGADTLDGGVAGDTLEGGAGNDVLIGGAASDNLYGGTGADRFTFRQGDFADSSWRDVIHDFNPLEGDRIDLSGLDAIAGGGDDAFVWRGTGGLTGAAGDLAYSVTNGNVLVVGDTDGDGIADISILIRGVTSLTAADFVL